MLQATIKKPCNSLIPLSNPRYTNTCSTPYTGIGKPGILKLRRLSKLILLYQTQVYIYSSVEPMSEKIISPCIGVCSIDNETGYCKGCFRTLEEISNWINYTEEERLHIIEEIKKRGERLNWFPRLDTSSLYR